MIYLIIAQKQPVCNRNLQNSRSQDALGAAGIITSQNIGLQPALQGSILGKICRLQIPVFIDPVFITVAFFFHISEDEIALESQDPEVSGSTSRSLGEMIQEPHQPQRY